MANEMPFVPLTAAFPSALADEAAKAVAVLGLQGHTERYLGRFEVSVSGQALLIPQRIHFDDPAPDLASLSVREHQIAQCLISRSTDGYKRQAALKAALPINEAWSVPFIVASAGDYVVQIVSEIYHGIDDVDRALVAEFISQNSNLYEITRQRIASYWNCYYKHQFQKQDYIGFKLLSKLEEIREPRHTHSE